MKKGKSEEEYLSFMEAYKLTGQAKVEGVKEFIENLVENGVKFLLFAHH
jgi:predicted peroxiredoxin